MCEKECLFIEYSDIDSDIPITTFKALLRKCGCKECKRMLEEWYNK